MPNYRLAVPLISNHNIGKTSPRCEMGKHKQLSLDTHQYKTTFTSTTKIVLRFSIIQPIFTKQRRSRLGFQRSPMSTLQQHHIGLGFIQQRFQDYCCVKFSNQFQWHIHQVDCYFNVWMIKQIPSQQWLPVWCKPGWLTLWLLDSGKCEDCLQDRS